MKLKKLKKKNIIYKHLIPALGNLKLQDIDNVILNKYFAMKLNEVSPNTVRILCACTIGLRREEICGLQWKCVDIDKRIIKINSVITQAGKDKIIKSTKSQESERNMYIPDLLYSTLLKVKEKQNEYKQSFGDKYNVNDYVLSWDNGDNYRPNYISDLFKKVMHLRNLQI